MSNTGFGSTIFDMTCIKYHIGPFFVTVISDFIGHTQT